MTVDNVWIMRLRPYKKEIPKAFRMMTANVRMKAAVSMKIEKEG